MQLLTRITWLTLFAILAIQPPHHNLPLSPLINSHPSPTPSHIHNYSYIIHHIQLSILYNSLHHILYTILCTIFYNRESHCKILYLILLYRYYNIVNTCNYIVTIIIDMRYNYLNKYNYIDSITKIKKLESIIEMDIYLTYT